MPHHMSLPFMPSCLILRDDRKQGPTHRKEFSLPNTTAVEADTALGAENMPCATTPALASRPGICSEIQAMLYTMTINITHIFPKTQPSHSCHFPGGLDRKIKLNHCLTDHRLKVRLLSEICQYPRSAQDG